MQGCKVCKDARICTSVLPRRNVYPYTKHTLTDTRGLSPCAPKPSRAGVYINNGVKVASK